MNLDPTGSPRHEQTVAVALRFIIAQDSVQRPGDGNRKEQSMVTVEVIESMGAPGGVEPPTNGLGNRCSIQLSYGATVITINFGIPLPKNHTLLSHFQPCPQTCYFSPCLPPFLQALERRSRTAEA